MSMSVIFWHYFVVRYQLTVLAHVSNWHMTNMFLLFSYSHLPMSAVSLSYWPTLSVTVMTDTIMRPDSSKTSALYKSFTYLLTYLQLTFVMWRCPMSPSILHHLSAQARRFVDRPITITTEMPTSHFKSSSIILVSVIHSVFLCTVV